MATFNERKQVRAERYQRFVHGWKQRSCSACSGSGQYDNDGAPSCGACGGSGRERFKSEDRAKPSGGDTGERP